MASRKNTLEQIDSMPEGFGRYFLGAYFSAIGSRGYWIFFIFIAVFGLIASRIALINILGYEYSAFIALFTSHFTAILVIHEFNRIKESILFRGPYVLGPHPRLMIWGIVLGSIAATAWILLFALIEIFALDLIFKIRNCDPLTGLGFYLTIPFLSSFFAASIAINCALTTKTRRMAIFFYFLIVFIFVLRAFLVIFRGPTIGLNDPFLGAIILPIYEEETNLDSGFLFSRLLVFAVSIFLTVFASLLSDSKFRNYSLRFFPANVVNPDNFLPEIQNFIVVLILIVLGLYYKGPLGIETSRLYLEHVLNGKLVTEHFIIRYPRNSEVERNIGRVAEEHEYYYWSINNEIGPVVKGPVKSYVYPDRRTKTFLTGVGSSVYAKPWTGEIHVEFNPNRINALKHELVHVLSANMGNRLTGSSWLGAYGEGIAEGVSWDTGNDLTHHQWAAALRKAIDPHTNEPFFTDDMALLLITRNFRQGGFYVGRITMNYYLSASYTKWFLDVFGAEAYRKAYIRNDTLAAVGLSPNDVAKAWLEYLDHVPVTESDIAYAVLAFSPPKFTVRVCAHELAEHERLASEFSSASLWKDAYREYTKLLEFSPQNIRYGYYQVAMLYNMENYPEALARIAQIKEWKTADIGWLSYLTQLEGDCYARMGRLIEAARLYKNTIDTAVSNNLRESATLRLEILKSPAREEFMNAQKEKSDARWRYERASEKDLTWLPVYYLGTSLVADRKYSEAPEYLVKCLRLNPPYPFVQRLCFYYLGICAYRTNQYELAEQNFRKALEISEQLFLESHSGYDSIISINRLDTWSASCADWLQRTAWRRTWQDISQTGE